MNAAAFRRILIQSLLVPVLLLLGVSAVLTSQIRDLVRTEHELDHSDQITARVQELQKLIIDQEVGLRGYQLTGDREMLSPFNFAAPVIPGRFNALELLVADNAEQANSLSQVFDRYQVWLAFAHSVLAMPAENTRTASLNLRGKQLMDDVRVGTDRMLTAEDQLRRDRYSSVQHQVRSVLMIRLATAFGTGLLIAIFVWSRLHKVSSAYRKLLEDARLKTEEVFESKQWFETTLESIGDGVIACDAEGRIELMNKVAREMTGWTMDEARNRPLEDVLHIIDEGTRARHESPIAIVKRQRTVVDLANHTLLIRKDGTELVLEDSAAPILDLNGNMTGIVLIFRNVTEKRRSDNALIANEKLAVAGRLAASIAHEIHNPLDSVANLHFLLGRETDVARREEYLRLADQELSRALQISRAMLGLYREPETPVDVNLAEAIESVLVLLDHRLAQQHVIVEKQLEEISIQGFPAELRQVFTNLILNAVDAAGPGGRICISVRRSETRNGAIIEIADSGPGIDPGIREKLFEAFFTTKGEKGSGLGLWVSQGIIQKHGGTLGIQEHPDTRLGGAVVEIYLPVLTEATAMDRATFHAA